jgi:predicted transcriptional regulator
MRQTARAWDAAQVWSSILTRASGRVSVPKIKGDLGPLERAIMEFLWDEDDTEVTVRDVLVSPAGRRSAYTTVMTVLDRLWRKGFVSRRKEGRAYVYRVRRTRDEHVGDLVGKVLAGAGDRRAAFIGFVRSVDRRDLEQLREAVRQVERERRTDR